MKQQQDWKKLLKADPTDWLLEPEDPGVRYLALRDIVDAGEKEVKAARTEAHKEGPIAIILDNMSPAGYWVQPAPVYYPKFRSVVWSIMSLGQLGASIAEDKRIKTASAYLLDHGLAKGGQFVPRGVPTDIGLCLQGNMLASLMDLSCTDSRLDTAYEWTARRVTGEGLPTKINEDGLALAAGVSGPFRRVKFLTDPLFGCRTNKGMSCAWGGIHVMTALSRLPAARRTGQIKQAIQAGVDFLFTGDPAKAEFPGHRKGTPDPRWWQFSFPAFGTDILKLAEALTALGYGRDPRLASTLARIRAKQDDNGRWPFEFFPRDNKMWVKYGSGGEPNKWVTLRAMRVLKQAGEQK